MKKKVAVLLIVLSVVFLSISAVSMAIATQSTSKIFGKYDWFLQEDGSYYNPTENLLYDPVKHIIIDLDTLAVYNVDTFNYGNEPSLMPLVSGTFGVAGVACLATVAIKKKQKDW